ncbi:MAG: TatD DNase family protein [Gammaproteobacteria bacterium]|jgi:TatD DNase family protein|nr:TatD DNase family protein [Gammaproteobacteria bacterium]
MLIDSHCHLNRLDLTNHNGDLTAALAFAREQGVSHMLCVSVILEDLPEMMAIARAHENIYVSTGLHPTEATSQEPNVEKLTSLASDPLVIAIGETGLDYYRCEGDITWQQKRFRTHIQAAKAIDKPLIIHTREAREDTIRIMQEENAQDPKGVMHCFTETWEMAKQAMDLNFYISFSGIVTFKNAKELQDIAKKIPLDRMLIETDAPYLAPVPYRGKPNEPAYVRHVAEFIAQLRGISFEEVAEKTTENFERLFLKR